MTSLILFFIALQLILLFFITLHDWIHLPPLTNIRELEKHHSVKDRIITSSINGCMVLAPLALTYFYRTHTPLWAAITILIFYGLLTLGTLFAWWIPYLFGSSAAHKAEFVEYRTTHRFLPTRGDHVVPNSLHVIMHLQIWSCLGIAVYLMGNYFKNS